MIATAPARGSHRQQVIIDPFFSTKRSGRGLGLSALRGIVREPGLGTTFTVLFPASDAPRTALPHPTQAAPLGDSAKGTMLLVEDEPLVRRSTRISSRRSASRSSRPSTVTRRFRSDPPTAFLSKPFQVEELEAVLVRVGVVSQRRCTSRSGERGVSTAPPGPPLQP